MGLVIEGDDFVRKYQIAKTTHGNNIDSYIEKYEERYLQELMGVELFKLFKAAITTPLSPPTDPIYLAIYDPIAEDDSSLPCDFYYYYQYCAPCGGIRRSDGLKEMLLGFIYFEYQRDQGYKPTATGTVKGKNENSRETHASENGLYERYNEAIGSYHTIQWFIYTKKQTDYPTFKGARKMLSGWL